MVTQRENPSKVTVLGNPRRPIIRMSGREPIRKVSQHDSELEQARSFGIFRLARVTASQGIKRLFQGVDRIIRTKPHFGRLLDQTLDLKMRLHPQNLEPNGIFFSGFHSHLELIDNQAFSVVGTSSFDATCFANHSIWPAWLNAAYEKHFAPVIKPEFVSKKSNFSIAAQAEPKAYPLVSICCAYAIGDQAANR